MTHATEEVAPDVAPELSAQAAGARPAAAAGGSTLIEFPGARSIPQWRKDLSERVREIQKRKAREAAPDADETASLPAEEPPGVAAADDSQSKESKEGSVAQSKEGSAASRLGLVPPLPNAPELNPLVAAALKRIERARQPPAARRSGPSGGRAAGVAVARVAEEQYESMARPQVEARGEAQQSPAAEASPSPELTQPVADAARPTGLVVVPPPQKTSADVESMPKPDALESKTEPVEAPIHEAAALSSSAAVAPQSSEKTAARAESEAVRHDRPAPRRVAEGVIDDAWLSRLEERILPPVNTAARTADDIAPLVPRLLAALIDLLLVVFLSSPFAAVVELTNGNWADPRVAASMGGVSVVLMFLYLTVSTALAGRTWGMSLFKLHTVDAQTALSPTTGQCVRRTLLYIVSLATFGLGLLYALFDAERRTAHDHLSGTVVVRH